MQDEETQSIQAWLQLPTQKQTQEHSYKNLYPWEIKQEKYLSFLFFFCFGIVNKMKWKQLKLKLNRSEVFAIVFYHFMIKCSQFTV